MRLSADNTNGIMFIGDYDTKGAEYFLEYKDEQGFYKDLENLRHTAFILICNVSLKMAKKLHKQYGITRLNS